MHKPANIMQNHGIVNAGIIPVSGRVQQFDILNHQIHLPGYLLIVFSRSVTACFDTGMHTWQQFAHSQNKFGLTKRFPA